MPKKDVPLDMATRLLNHGPLVIVGSKHGNRETLMAVAWITPLSKKPPMAGIMVTRKRFSYELISASGAFSISVPGKDLLEAAIRVGTVSGRQGEDKFKDAGITREEARLIPSPLVKECLAHIECKLLKEEEFGDHVLMAGEILRASVEEEAFTDHWILERFRTIAHLGGEWFGETVS